MKSLQDSAAFFFVAAVACLSAISVLGVWNVFEKDVIVKSFETLGFLALIAIVIMIAGMFLHGGTSAAAVAPEAPNPLFSSLRKGILSLFIIATTLLALLGILAIWDVIADKQVLYKAIGSVAIMSFGSFIIVMTCLQREGGEFIQKQGKTASVGTIILALLGAWAILSFMQSL